MCEERVSFVGHNYPNLVQLKKFDFQNAVFVDNLNKQFISLRYFGGKIW